MEHVYAKVRLNPGRWYSDQITLTGDAGVGTSTLLENLKGIYGIERWVYRSAGDWMRAQGDDRGMDDITFARHCAEHPEEMWDMRCDLVQAAWGDRNCTAIDGRLSHIMCKYAFHVKVICALDLRADRRVKKPKYTHYSFQQMKDHLLERDARDKARYDALYPGHNWSLTDYDCVLDSGELSEREMVDQLLAMKVEWGLRRTGALYALSTMPPITGEKK